MTTENTDQKVPSGNKKFHRTMVQIPMSQWIAFKRAHEIQTKLLSHKHGVEVKGSFTAWVRTKVDELIKEYS